MDNETSSSLLAKTSQFISNNKIFLRKIIAVLVILFTVLLILFPIDLDGAQGLGYLGVFVGTLAATATFSPMHMVIPIVAATKLNPLLVAFFAASGMTLGEVSGYLIGGGTPEKVKDYKWFKRIEKWMTDRGDLTVFVFTLIPAGAIFDVISLIAGGTGYPLPRFLAICFVGRLLRSLILVYFGSVISEIFPAYFN